MDKRSIKVYEKPLGPAKDGGDRFIVARVLYSKGRYLLNVDPITRSQGNGFTGKTYALFSGKRAVLEEGVKRFSAKRIEFWAGAARLANTAPWGVLQEMVKAVEEAKR